MARNLSVVINHKPWVDTDMSQRKVHVLQRKMSLFSCTGKAFELMISLEIGRGIGLENTATKSSDAAMVATIRSPIGSLTLMKAVMRKMFPT